MRRSAVVAVLALAACRSPLAADDESGPPEDPQKVGAGIHGWPFFERAPGGKGVRTDVLWPLASVRAGESGDWRRADFLWPVVHFERGDATTRLAVRPIFDVTGGDTVDDVRLFLSLVRSTETPEESVFDVVPIWWSRRTRQREHEVLVPFFGRWLRRGKPEEEGGPPGEVVEEGSFLWPFGGTSKDGTESTDWWASGLVIHGIDEADSRDSWKLLLGALERTTWDDGGEEFAFPLLSHRADASEESSDWRFLWPGLVRFRREKERTQDWALPFWYRECDGTSRTAVLFPFWFEHEDEGESLRLLFPLCGIQRHRDFERRYYGGNLLVTTADPGNERGDVDVLWPLIHHGTDAAGWDARVFPLVWIDRHEEHAHTHLWPLFGHRRDGDESEVSVAWPLFTYEAADDGWEAHLPAPLVEIDRRGERRKTSVWPLFAAHSNAASGAYHGDVLWILSNWEGDGEGKSDFRILWRLVQATDTGEKTVFAVNPFFRHETNDRGDDHWSALFGLVARTREADDVDWRLLWFIHL